MIIKTHFFKQYNSITRKSRICKNSITSLTKNLDIKFNLLLLLLKMIYRYKFIETPKSCYSVILWFNLLTVSKLHYNKGLLYSCYTVIL